jgi:hypothetical protein
MGKKKKWEEKMGKGGQLYGIDDFRVGKGQDQSRRTRLARIVGNERIKRSELTYRGKKKKKKKIYFRGKKKKNDVKKYLRMKQMDFFDNRK